MKDNILLLGIGEAQLPMIKYALNLNLGIIGFDGDLGAKGKEFCDHFECLDIKNRDEVEKAARKWNKKVGIDGVLAPAVQVGPSVGRVVDILNLRGIGEKAAGLMTDKIYRRGKLDKERILQPKWAISADSWEVFPAIVKPRNDAGSRGVLYAADKNALKGLKFDIIEEFLPGWELSVEVIIFPDSTFTSISADRNYRDKLKYMPHIMEDGCSLPSKLSPKILLKIDNLIKKLIKVFNLSACCMKLDLIIKENLIYLIECPPRLGGGKLSSVMIPMAYDINYWKLALKLAMGYEITKDEITPKYIKNVVQRYKFPSNPKSHHDRLFSVEKAADTYEEALRKCTDALSIT